MSFNDEPEHEPEIMPVIHADGAPPPEPSSLITEYHSWRMQQLDAPGDLVPWCVHWDVLTNCLIDYKYILINLGHNGAWKNWTHILSHHGGIDYARWVQPYCDTPLKQFIRWKCNGLDYVDAGNLVYGRILTRFLDTDDCPNLHAALGRLSDKSLGNIIETILGALSVQRGDVITGVASLPPQTLQRIEATFPSIAVLEHVAEILSQMVSTMLVISPIAQNSNATIYELLI